MEYISDKHEIRAMIAAGISSFFQCSLFYWCEIGKNRSQAGTTVSFKILKEYSGFSVALCYIVSSRVLGFGIFESIKKIQMKNKLFSKLDETKAHLTSAIATGILKPILLYPIETIKIQMQVNNVLFKEAFRRMINLEFKLKVESLILLMLKNFTSYFAWFESRGTLRHYFNINKRKSKVYENFIIGSISSGFSFLVSSPFSTLKTLRQIGNVETINHLYKEGGIRRFHHGFIFHVVNMVGGGGIFNILYSHITEHKINH